jgi:hypothetical protein
MVKTPPQIATLPGFTPLGFSQKVAKSHQGYHQFQDELGEPYGSFEVFWVGSWEESDTNTEPGWFWWPCFPGCIPDSDAIGPFSTSREAFFNAMEVN